MSFLTQFAKPDPDFDPTDKSVLDALYGPIGPDGKRTPSILPFINGQWLLLNRQACSKKETVDPKCYIVVDPKGQRAKSVQERIDEKLKDHKDLSGQPPNEEEAKRITEMQIKCSGWLEGLKIDLEGKDQVPIEHFNRLAKESEDITGFFSRDRVRMDALHKKECTERDDEINAANEEIKRLQDKENADLDDARKQIQELQSQIQKLEVEKEKYEEADKQIQALQDRLYELEKEKEKYWSVDDDIQALTTQIEELEKMEQTLEKEKNKNKILEQGTKDKNERINKLQAQLSQLKLEAEECKTVKETNSKLNDTIKGLQDQLDQLKLESEGHRNSKGKENNPRACDDLEAENIVLREQIEPLKNQISQLEKQKDEDDKNSQQKAEDLQEELAQLKVEKAGEKASFERRVKDLKNRYEAAQKAIGQISTTERGTDKDKLVEEYANEEIRKLRELLDKAEADRAASEAVTNKRRDDLMDKYNAFERQFRGERAEVNEQKKTNTTLKDSLRKTELILEIEQRRQDVGLRAEIDRLEHELQESQDMNMKLAKSQTDFEKKSRDLETEFETKTRDLKRKITQKEAELLDDYKKKIQNLEDEVKQKKAKLEADTATIHAAATRFEQRREEVNEKLKENEKELAKLKQDLDDCQKQHKTTTQAEVDKLKDRLRQCQEEKATGAATQAKVDEDEFKKLKEDLESCQQHRTATQAKIDQLKDQLNRCQAEKTAAAAKEPIADVEAEKIIREKDEEIKLLQELLDTCSTMKVKNLQNEIDLFEAHKKAIQDDIDQLTGHFKQQARQHTDGVAVDVDCVEHREKQIKLVSEAKQAVQAVKERLQELTAEAETHECCSDDTSSTASN
ncbi:hypothetical protein SCAR479_08841 [Seiridium cardinale]|uniref:Uncharacterized protein n=1 Tax=Seiridium cardinale TaxID=138064 RepID=A0ABR2XL27_9PEZI